MLAEFMLAAIAENLKSLTIQHIVPPNFRATGLVSVGLRMISCSQLYGARLAFQVCVEVVTKVI